MNNKKLNKESRLKKDLQKGIDSLDQGRGIVADEQFYKKVVERGEMRLNKKL